MSDKETLDHLIELAERHARLVLLELKMPSLMASWVLMTKSGAQIVATPWENEWEKRVYAQMLRALMRKRHVTAYSFVSESWSRMLEAEEWDEETKQPLDGIQARNHPAREEAVIACACTDTLRHWKRWRIVREATTERIIDLKEQPFPETDEAPQSWIFEMLAPKT